MFIGAGLAGDGLAGTRGHGGLHRLLPAITCKDQATLWAIMEISAQIRPLGIYKFWMPHNQSTSLRGLENRLLRYWWADAAFQSDGISLSRVISRSNSKRNSSFDSDAGRRRL